MIWQETIENGQQKLVRELSVMYLEAVMQEIVITIQAIEIKAMEELMQTVPFVLYFIYNSWNYEKNSIISFKFNFGK